MGLTTVQLFLDLNTRGDTSLAQSLEDPTKIDPGPLWSAGDKREMELYLVKQEGSGMVPVEISADYSCEISARRLDGLSPTIIFSANLARQADQQNGHSAFVGSVDLSGSAVTDTLLIDDAEVSEGVRLRVQAKISNNGATEIFRPSFIVVIRANVDAS